MTCYVESCTILVCMLVGLRSFVISSDYRVYMGSSMMVDRFGDCYYTCALINWTVLLHASTRRNQSDATVAVRKCQGSQGGLHHCHQGLRGSVSHKPPPLGLELCLGGLRVYLWSLQIGRLLLVGSSWGNGDSSLVV